jgi:hypothetical protein
MYMHFPPEEIPLPSELLPYPFTPTQIATMQTQSYHALLPPVLSSWNPKKMLDYWTFDSMYRPIRGTCTLKMLYHEWLTVTDDDEGAWRDGYIIWPPPTSVEVYCHNGSKFVEDYHGTYYDGDPDGDVREEGDYLWIERKEGVRWRDMLDEVTGTVFNDVEFWELCAEHERFTEAEDRDFVLALALEWRYPSQAEK